MLYTNVCVDTHSKWKHLHQLCSLSGYCLCHIVADKRKFVNNFVSNKRYLHVSCSTSKCTRVEFAQYSTLTSRMLRLSPTLPQCSQLERSVWRDISWQGEMYRGLNEFEYHWAQHIGLAINGRIELSASGNGSEIQNALHNFPVIPIVQPTRYTYYLKSFILVKRSTCFGRSFCPSSGAQKCVYSSGICQTAAATCCYSSR
jgi:hypothetical protein